MTTKKEPKETSVNTYKSSLKSLGESIDINNITNIKQVMDILYKILMPSLINYSNILLCLISNYIGIQLIK